MDWIEHYEEHPVHSTLNQLDRLLRRVARLAKREKEELGAHDRVRDTHDLTRKVLRSVNPVVTPRHVLGNLNNDFEQIVQNVQQYISDERAQHITQAAERCDRPLGRLGLLPVIRSPEDVERVKESVASFRKSAGQHLRYLEEDTEKVRTALKELEAEIKETGQEVKSQKGRLDQAIATFQQQFREAEQERANRASQAETSRQEAFTQAQEKRAQTNQKAFEQWNERLTKTTQSFEEKTRDLLNTAKAQVDEVAESFKGQATETLETLSAHEEKAAELVQVIARTGMAGGYQEVADQEAKRAFWWHVLGVIGVAGFIYVAINIALATTVASGIRWETLGTRVFVAAAFGLLAAYAERQANRYSESERRNRRWQLVLASINPYLNDLPEDQQQEVKRLVAERIFTASEPLADKDETVGAASLFALLRTAVSNLTKR